MIVVTILEKKYFKPTRVSNCLEAVRFLQNLTPQLQKELCSFLTILGSSLQAHKIRPDHRGDGFSNLVHNTVTIHFLLRKGKGMEINCP